MEFFALCAAVSFVFGVLAIPQAKGGLKFLNWLPLLVMELPCAGYFLWVLLTKPGGGPGTGWGWKFDLMILTWIAGSVLLGWAFAWIVCGRKKER